MPLLVGPQRPSPTPTFPALDPPHLARLVSIFLGSPQKSPFLVGVTDWMFVFPQNLHAGALSPKVMAFGGGAFGR